MKPFALALAVFTLVCCNRGLETKEAVRQGVVDYLATRNLNVSSMNVDVTAVTFRQNQADATVSFVPKGGGAAQGMTMRYTLEKQGSHWVVKNRADSGQNPHGGGMMPGGGMPGGTMPGGNPHGSMPMPGEMPPGHPATGTKK